MADGNLNLKQGLNLAPQSSDPSNPVEGDIFCSDGTPRAAGYWQYINGAWTEFGGGGSGGINYLEGDNNTAENGIGDWATYADAAAVNPVDGTGGAATLTFTQNSTTQNEPGYHTTTFSVKHLVLPFTPFALTFSLV